jgi:hypothetical protein
LQEIKPNSKETRFRKRMEEARNKHEKRLLALRAKMKGTATTSDKQAPTTLDAGSVEYEDVSEQVEARLKAKQARREAAKKEKKRKRDSGDSHGVEVRDDEVVVDNPAKKRSRSDRPGSAFALVAVKDKRQKHGREVDDADGGSTAKRAKMKG